MTTRGRIPSTSTMVRALEAKLEDMAIAEAQARGMTEQEIEQSLRQVRLRRASLHMQGAPLLYRDKEESEGPNDPTAELQKKTKSYLGSETAGSDIRVKRYRIKDPIEAHGDKFEDRYRFALEQFRLDAEVGQSSKVSDLNSSGGGGPGSRLGGLGNVPQSIRDRHARHMWVCDRLTPEFREVAAALLTRDMKLAGDELYKVGDFGARMFPSEKDVNRKWGSGMGALWCLAALLANLYDVCPVWVRSREAG